MFGKGDGQDLVRLSYDTTPGKLSTLQLKAGVDPSELMLKQVYDNDTGGNALEVPEVDRGSVIATLASVVRAVSRAGPLRVFNSFTGAAPHYG